MASGTRSTYRSRAWPMNRFMLVFFRRTFLFIFLRKVNFKVVVCAVKENLAEQSLRILCSFSPHISGNKKPGLESHWK